MRYCRCATTRSAAMSSWHDRTSDADDHAAMTWQPTGSRRRLWAQRESAIRGLHRRLIHVAGCDRACAIWIQHAFHTMRMHWHLALLSVLTIAQLLNMGSPGQHPLSVPQWGSNTLYGCGSVPRPPNSCWASVEGGMHVGFKRPPSSACGGAPAGQGQQRDSRRSLRLGQHSSA
eukprot:jgi/Ulvmu1/3636/UM017_0048.1